MVWDVHTGISVSRDCNPIQQRYGRYQKNYRTFPSCDQGLTLIGLYLSSFREGNKQVDGGLSPLFSCGKGRGCSTRQFYILASQKTVLLMWNPTKILQKQICPKTKEASSLHTWEREGLLPMTSTLAQTDLFSRCEFRRYASGFISSTAVPLSPESCYLPTSVLPECLLMAEILFHRFSSTTVAWIWLNSRGQCRHWVLHAEPPAAWVSTGFIIRSNLPPTVKHNLRCRDVKSWNPEAQTPPPSFQKNGGGMLP